VTAVGSLAATAVGLLVGCFVVAVVVESPAAEDDDDSFIERVDAAMGRGSDALLLLLLLFESCCVRGRFDGGGCGVGESAPLRDSSAASSAV